MKTRTSAESTSDRLSQIGVRPKGTVPLICFSHRRWGLAWQRPQQILTRMAEVHPVYYVEAPILDDIEAPDLHINTDHGITILTPILPTGYHELEDFCGDNNFAIQSVLSDYFAEELGTVEIIAWYYTPMALDALPANLIPGVTVYDVMDELAALRGAPTEARAKERLLLQAADLVFCSSPSLHQTRKFRHPRVFSMPSGVDELHFRYVDGKRPDDIASLTNPIIGFSGVLDHRVDMELIAGIADAKPDWSMVLIGPLANIEERDIPTRDNIHYLGKRSYDELARYHASFDAAILPFSLPEATHSDLPARTLELLAGSVPVVSTPIQDVVDLYGEVVEIAATPEAFIDAIQRLWDENPVEQSFRQHLVDDLLAGHSWNVMASRMNRLINDVLTGRSTFDMVLHETLAQGLPLGSTTPSTGLAEITPIVRPPVPSTARPTAV